MESRQVKMDPEKIRAATEWLVPESPKWLQSFLGFSNFYCIVEVDASH